ncbi:MAG: hypothetical protein JWN04_730 [Myxococcaceae bacterium]|nr:hypothetical protein [Myxococcaceae bacterium]
MKQARWIWLALLGVAGLAWAAHPVREGSSPERIARRVAERNHVQVGFGAPSSFFAPPATSAAIEGVHVEPADPAQARIALDAVEQALLQYPEDFVQRLVHAIFVCGELSVSNVHAGGTYGPSWLLIGASKIHNREDTFWASYRALHHELSSFVLKHDNDTYADWLALEPTGWHFSETREDELVRAAQAAPDPATGFISGYGTSNPENDFNSYGENIFSDPELVKELAKKSPLIRKKLDFVIERYVRVDPAMRERFVYLGLLAR